MRDDFFDKLIQDKADRHEAPVPADTWANIEQKKKKRRYVIYWWMTGILLLTGIGMAGIYKFKNTSHLPAMAEQKKAEGSDRKNVADNNNIKNSTLLNTDSTTQNGQQNNPSAKNTIITAPVDDHQKNINSGNSIINKRSFNNLTKNNTVKASRQKNIFSNTTSIAGTNTTGVLNNTNNYYSKRNNKRKQNGRSNMIIKNGNTDDPIVKDEEIIETTSSPLAKITMAIAGNDSLIAEAQKTLPDKNNDTLSSVKFTIDNADTTKKIAKTKNKPKPASAKNNIFVEASVTPFISIQNNDRLLSVSRTTVTPMHKAEFTANDIHTATEASFAYTLALRKSIGNKISLSTGLQYSFIKENVKLSGVEKNTYYNVVKRLEPNNGSPFLYNDTLATISTGKRLIDATNSYEFVSIPLLLQYELINKKSWLLSVTGGTYLNFSSKYNNTIEGKLQPAYQNGDAGSSSKNKFTADIFAGLRFARRFGSRLQFFAEPGIRYNLIKYDMQGVINKKYIQRTGLAMGVSWKLGK